MNKVDTYTIKGTKVEGITLPKEFSEKENNFLIAQAIRVYMEKVHFGMHSAQTRAEVSRTKKKWYKQKGTGGARHGAKSAPIFVGGGVAHGPRAIRRAYSLPLALARKALSVAFSMKVKAGELVLVNDIGKITKTKEASALIGKIAGNKKVTLVTSDANSGVKRYFKNIETVKNEIFKNMNVYKVMFGGIIILDSAIFEAKKVVAKGTKNAN